MFLKELFAYISKLENVASITMPAALCPNKFAVYILVAIPSRSKSFKMMMFGLVTCIIKGVTVSWFASLL